MTLKLTPLDKLSGLVFAAQMILAGNTAINGPTGPIPTHFTLSGQPDGWSDRTELALMIAGMATLGLLLSGGLGLAAARAEEDGDTRRRRGLKAAQAVILIAFVGIAGLTVALSLGGVGDRADGPGTMMAVFGLLLAAIGALLGRVGPNPWVGVKTPWAYKSRTAWDRSNRLAGRLWFFGGIGAIALSTVIPQPLGLQALFVFVIASALLAVFESWRVWRTDPDRQPF
ncbi:SdpI family protein [Brevundimonas goettingensis]|uniref:SdpI family protein n=1 Tax=Brevundimonas goettingensis TaxID=2774190 RepID=A0A975C5I5_9CAUL|nr:SdpI family protein [Brevundimonas goettingensis]QTC92340.1 SdpI family protein [Brevundimonas goettingensis]